MSGLEIEPYAPQAPGNLFGTADPATVVVKATETAKALADVIKQRGLYVEISGKAHVRVEAWTMLGSMLGVFPVIVWTRKMDDPPGWEARCEAQTLAGAVVGAAEAQCDRTESRWKNRDDYALRAMAQTRAVSRAMRAPLGFIVQLAGYDATPAEEMPSGGAEKPEDTSGKATQAQHRKLHALLREAQESNVPPPEFFQNGEPSDDWDAYSQYYAFQQWGTHSRSDLTKDQMSRLITHIDEARIPFG